MKLFKNRFFVIALAVAVALSSFSLVLVGMGRTDVLGATVRTVTYPLRWTATQCANAIRGFGRYFGASEAQNAEIEALRDALDAAQSEAERAAALQAENDRLRAYLGIRQSHPSLRFEEAVVIGRSTEVFAPVLTLNRGSAHGIRVNMPVITPEGVVGYVYSVGLVDCQVRTLFSSELSMSAYLERSGVSGIVSGRMTSSGGGEMLCVMEYMENQGGNDDDMEQETAVETATGNDGDEETGAETATEDTYEGPDYLALYGIDVRVGDVLLTSGVGVVYPFGLEIGRVKEVRVDSYSRRLTLVIEPSATLGRDLTYALIVTDTGAGS